MTPQIQTEYHQGVGVLRMHRPPVHALSLSFLQEWNEAVEATLASGVNALVVTATGETFCAGLDLKEIPTYTQMQHKQLWTTLRRCVRALYGCPIPVVAALNGHTIAGGLAFAISCDYRVAHEGCKFGLPAVRAGVSFPKGALAVLRAEISPSTLRYLMLTGRTMTAKEALQRELIDELQPKDCTLSRAIEVAEELASSPSEGYRRIKLQLRHRVLESLQDLPE